jgi:Rrf2 family protein
MQQLVKAKFVTSSRGPSGGFLLTKEPKDITLLDVFEVIEGTIPTDPAYFDNSECPFKECYIKLVTRDLTLRLREALRTKTLADFLLSPCNTHE